MIKVNGYKVEINYFPDNTQKLELPTYVISSDKDVNITLFYENDNELFTLYCIVNHIREHYNTLIHLFLPYVPNARMDRTHEEKEVFTLKHFASFINGLNFASVVVLDPHSNVSPAVLHRCIVRQPCYYINQVAIPKSRPDVIFFPDEGAMKRYSEVVSVKKPIAFGMKKRDWTTGAILGLDVFGDVEALKGAKVLIIDDICSRGGTFYHSAKKLKELGAAEIDLYITHCEDTIQEGELLKDNGLINKIYTTDSLIKIQNEKIEVMSV